METTDASATAARPPYKKREFESYVLWLSMPSVLRGQPRHVLERMGIDDEVAVSLLDIRSQAEFARHFGIKDPGTLSDWNRRIEAEGGLMRHIRTWAGRLTPNVVSALYRETTKTGRAAEVRAWMDIVEGQ
jgi:hypothetical protein